jgi:hypothetical protein
MTNFCHSRENGNTPVKCGTSFFRFFTSFRMTICLFCHSRENGNSINSPSLRGWGMLR